MNTYNRITSILIACVSIFISIYLNSIITFATEGDGISRPLYSYQEANEGAIDHITFNSIKVIDTDVAWAEAHGLELPLLGNETNFVGARKNTGINTGSGNIWEGPEITAEDGETYIIRLYVHNNSPEGMDAVAEDTKVRFYVPYGSASSQTVNGWLTSSNAVPQEYSDTVTFKSKDGNPFSLNYIYGSALLENSGCANGDGIVLPDSITNQGNPTNKAEDEWTLIGYDALDGRVPGCYEYINYVSIMVRVVYDHEFTVETKVRLANSEDDTWYDTVDANVGDKVEFQIHYQNTSTDWQEHVAVRDALPSNLRYVEGSTKLMSANHPSGDPVNEDYLVGDGLKIGAYSANANAYLMFTAEVVDDNLADGSNTLINWAQVRVGDTVMQDDARVYVQNNKVFIIAAEILSFLIIVCLTAVIILIKKVIRQKQNRHGI
ncbi:hypothetical protein [uncultured Bacteroides sp.]|uniref:hypothetical protein n=1 Tax=uncultured Bacteroides sp. TaxID=162156 RepID=UPI00259191F8|nr:hypothetical protein [uncultured Bacteroides sp.]